MKTKIPPKNRTRVTHRQNENYLIDQLRRNSTEDYFNEKDRNFLTKQIRKTVDEIVKR